MLSRENPRSSQNSKQSEAPKAEGELTVEGAKVTARYVRLLQVGCRNESVSPAEPDPEETGHVELGARPHLRGKSAGPIKGLVRHRRAGLEAQVIDELNHSPTDDELIPDA